MELPAIRTSVRTEQHGGDFRMLPAVGRGPLGPEHVTGRREPIGPGGAGGQHCGRKDAFGRPTAAGIQDMAEAAAGVPKRLELGPGSAQGPVGQAQLPDAAICAERIANADQPACGCRGRTPGQDAALAAVDQKVGQTALGEPPGAAIDGIALANAAEIDLEARLQEADRVAGRIELDEPSADPRRAAAKSAAAGTAGLRRANPQTSQSGPAVMSQAPPVSRCNFAANSKSPNNRGSTSTGSRAAI